MDIFWNYTILKKKSRVTYLFGIPVYFKFSLTLLKTIERI